MNTNTLAGLAAAATVSLATAADSRPPNLDWFVGHWCSDQDGRFIEEEWLAPKGDLAKQAQERAKLAREKSKKK